MLRKIFNRKNKECLKKKGEKEYEKYLERQNKIKEKVRISFNKSSYYYIQYFPKVGRHSQYNLNIEDLATELVDEAIKMRLEDKAISKSNIDAILPKVEKEDFDYLSEDNDWDEAGYKDKKEALEKVREFLTEVMYMINEAILELESLNWEHSVLGREVLINDSLEKLKLSFVLENR